MRYLVDTNVLRDVRRRSDEPGARWIERQPVFDLAISAITLVELDVEVRRLERKRPIDGARLRAWLEETVVAMFEDRILSVDARTARETARLHVPDPMGEHDALIAGTALANGLTLVTRNVRDFERTGVAVLDPWALGP